MISMIIEPVALEYNGNEVDSTEDLLAKIGEINSKISGPNTPTEKAKDLKDFLTESLKDFF